MGWDGMGWDGAICRDAKSGQREGGEKGGAG